MGKKVIKINENTIKKIIKEAVKSYINEAFASETLRNMAKRFGGVSHVNPKYRLDRTNISLSVIKDFNDVPMPLHKFFDEVCRFKNGYTAIAIKPEYESNENQKQKILNAISSYTEVTNDKNDGIEPISWYEDERDDDGRHFKSKQTLSPQGVRTRRHKASRGKPTKGLGVGSDKDYQKYVNNYGERIVKEKYNGYVLDDYVAIPVDDLWGKEAYDIEEDLKRYGYDVKRIPDENVKSDFEFYGYDYDPEVHYLTLSRYGSFWGENQGKLLRPNTPKIGTTNFKR